MRFIEAPARHDFENILPLINVVFLLLIFFMLAGSFSKPDFYKVMTPVADNDNPADRKELTVLMNAQGQIAIDSTAYTDEQFTQFIRDQLSAGKHPSLQLKADAQVVSRRLLEVMELLGANGLESLHLLTLPPDKK